MLQRRFITTCDMWYPRADAFSEGIIILVISVKRRKGDISDSIKNVVAQDHLMSPYKHSIFFFIGSFGIKLQIGTNRH